MPIENPEWAPKTFRASVLGFAGVGVQAVEDTHTFVESVGTSDTYDMCQVQKLEALAAEYERVARGLRALKQHARYPESQVECEPYVYAVSSNNGRSLRVVDSEFTARRYLKLEGTTGVVRSMWRMMPNGPRPAAGTDLVFGSMSPEERGWRRVGPRA